MFFRSQHSFAIIMVLVLLAIVPPVAAAFNDDFYVGLATRVLIFAIAAISLDLIVGYAGMNSLGHAVYIGVGAYSVGILNFYGIDNGFIHFGVAILASALVALFIGASSVRTSGIHFIMISLAFGQMLYYLAVSVNTFGGDDGLRISRHSNFVVGTLRDPVVLYYVCFGILLVVLFTLHQLVESRFGMVLRAIKSNEARVVSVGISPYRYRLVGFVISGVVCGIAGALLANQNLFISPASMHWSRSGEILIMTILGGMGSLSGGILGAGIYVGLEYFLSRLTEHWQAIMGPIIVLVILFANRGVFGMLSATKRRRK
ncbi:MAG: branched-chain amino acid ABC transporter permease [Xanthobacteraceae bacterium]|nr:branched-chain amino acid ABC transporter permease [Xanthobacteraceae bacterium]